MARIEGTGIKEPSKDAKVANLNFLRNPKKFLQNKIDQKLDSMTKSGKTPFGTSIGGSAVGEEGLGRFGNPNDLSDASETFERRDFFSMKTDPRNEVKTASAGDSFDESDYKGYLKAVGIKNPRGLSPTFNRLLRENYQIDKKEGIYKDGQIFNRSDTLLNKAPKQEKPSFVEQTKNFAGSIFNAVTGTQPAAASQIPGGMPTGTQFTSSNLDAAKATTGDTSFASYRMAGQPPRGEQEQKGSGIVTPFSQTSMGKGEGRKVTPFSETSMGKGEPVKVTPFRQTSMGNKTVTVDGQTVAARQTVASLPSDYKQTEAREFAKAAAFQQAKKNPNVTTSLDSKGQVVVKPVQRGRGESGTSDRTAQGNQARVQQNAKARAQAAAIQRKISGKSISQTKAANKAAVRKSAAERQAAFKKTRKSTVGQRRAAAKASVKAAAKKRHSAFKKRRKARRSKKGKK